MRMTKSATFAAIAVLALAGCKATTTNTSGNTTATNAIENASTTTAAAGASAIDGTWKTDVASIKIDSKPDQLMLKGGQFSCPSCVPPLAIPADGAFHPVTGRPYADHIAIKVDDDHNVTRTGQKAGKTTNEVKYSVSADGKTLTANFTDMSGSKPATFSYTENRVGTAPAGAHAISGSWERAKMSNASEEGLTVTYKFENDTLHMSTPTGQSYDAKLDGTETAVKGDVGGTIVSVKKLSDNSFEETDKRDGKVVDVVTMTVGADGKMNVKDENKLNGSTTTYVAAKQ